jgi:hypothetical protein
VTFCGQAVPEGIKRIILSLSTRGESPDPVLRFYERLQKNPSKRSVDQLFPFLEKMNIPLTNDGCFLAYKGVNDDYTDRHSSTISNKPGTTVKIPRNLVSDDPREACHFGLHVGAVSYAKSFADRMVICKVDPQNVVCVPYDSSQEKMRVCEYKVIGNYGDNLPDDVTEDELETVHDEKAVEVIEEEIDNTEQLKSSKGSDVDIIVRTKRIEKKIDKKSFTKYKGMNAQKLMALSIEDLRKYATYGLEIVGASKIPGGKAALITRILKAKS